MTDDVGNSEGSPEDDRALDAAVEAVAGAGHAVALTGAGISVESGIPDFRSPAGLWSVFDPEEYATLSCFLHRPEKAWRLYRALGRTIAGKEPNAAHVALASLEAAGRLAGVVTQNIDGLHQAGGSRRVLEIHGDWTHLQCLGCGRLEPFLPAHLEDGPVPACAGCGGLLKPNVVLFEEAVRAMDEIQALIRNCDVLLVVGTSAEVAPASLLPSQVHRTGGVVLEFNLGPTQLTAELGGRRSRLVRGPAGLTLPRLANGVRARREAGAR